MTDHKNGDKKETISYRYDKAGNRTKKTKGSAQTSYTYNGLDQLLMAVTERDGEQERTVSYEYDVNGNQVKESDSKSQVTTVNEYDAENRLSRAVITMPSAETLPDPASGLSVETAPEAGSTDQIKTITQENLYNGNGQRIRKSEGAKEIHYFYQDGVVSYTMEGKKETKAVQNLLGLEENVIMAESDGLEYHLYNKDIQGSTTSVLDADGTGELSYEYDDFGETEINGNSAFQNEICYTGGIYDEMTGLYYLNARYYDPESGRFLTEDTYRGELNEPDTLHLYVYCKNNPINYVDPSGHFVFSVGVEISYAFLLGYYKTVAIAIDGKGDFKILMTVGGIVNTAFGSASCSVVGCLYVNYNSVQKVTSGISSSIGGVVSVGKKYSLSAGVDVSGKSRTLVISGSAGVATSVKRKYIECKLGGTVTSKKYNLNKMLKKDKIGKKYSTKLKGKTVTMKKASKTYIEVSCKSFPKKFKIYSAKKIKVK